MTKGFLTIAAVLALVLLFAAAAVPEEITIPETEPIIAPELTVSAQIPTARYRLTADERELICKVLLWLNLESSRLMAKWRSHSAF